MTSGYAGGKVHNPTYEQICTGTTDHAEVIRIVFNRDEVSYERILEVFWMAHDPTTLNQQGNDIGTQYRSVIFYHDETQREIAEQSKARAQGGFDKEIVTRIEPLPEFYPAEHYHQNYFNEHTRAPYCQAIIMPKVRKLRESGVIR